MVQLVDKWEKTSTERRVRGTSCPNGQQFPWPAFFIGLDPLLGSRLVLRNREKSHMSVHPCFHLSVSPAGPEAWLSESEAWLVGPEAWLAGPEAWLAGHEAYLEGPEAWLVDPESWLVGPEA